LTLIVNRVRPLINYTQLLANCNIFYQPVFNPFSSNTSFLPVYRAGKIPSKKLLHIHLPF